MSGKVGLSARAREGDRVVDVGTGSGILAMFMADSAQCVAVRNDLPAMGVIRGDAAAFASDRPVDVVMGEFAGMMLLDEWHHFAAFVVE